MNRDRTRFPKFEDKHAEDAVLTPETFDDLMREEDGFEPPETAVLCFDRGLAEYVTESYDVEEWDRGLSDFYVLSSHDVGLVANFGIGAPVTAIAVEDMIEYGVSNFVIVGYAGSLQPELGLGDTVVGERAIRDEGTSYHYVEPSKYAHASTELTRRIEEGLDQRGREYTKGDTWTVDAPYRETVEEIRKYRKEGVLTVEMEASVLFALAEYRDVEASALFTISDSLADLEWEPYFDDAQGPLRNLFDSLVKIL